MWLFGTWLLRGKKYVEYYASDTSDGGRRDPTTEWRTRGSLETAEERTVPHAAGAARVGASAQAHRWCFLQARHADERPLLQRWGGVLWCSVGNRRTTQQHNSDDYRRGAHSAVTLSFIPLIKLPGNYYTDEKDDRKTTSGRQQFRDVSVLKYLPWFNIEPDLALVRFALSLLVFLRSLYSAALFSP
jgi:hypothetical protein